MIFSELKLIPPILKAVEEAGYSTPSPIQQKAIPPVLNGQDLLACAQTGTGKTAAFALPILQLLAAKQIVGKKREIRALVLTPTRELALQIYENFSTYGKHLKLRSTVVFGGVNQAPQVAQLKRGVDILVATPGRLNDLISQGYISLNVLEIFVLDEADRMLDMGFVQDVKKIMRQIPKNRQTLLFSATMPKEIVSLANSLLQNPQNVFVTPPSTTVEKIEQHLYKVDKANKRHLLAKLLEKKEIESALVFTRTKHGADKVVKELKKENVQALAIHGNKSQGARQTALSAFKNGKVQVLVATDIAARGLDINELSHVINYDLPNIPETYVHRIGRTGRAGKNGIALSFCSCEELPFLADIEKLIGIAVPEESKHDWPMEIFEPAKKLAPEAKTKQKANLRQKRPALSTKLVTKLAAKPEKKPETKLAEKPLLTNGIVTRRPVWATHLPEKPQSLAKGEEEMKRSNKHRSQTSKKQAANQNLITEKPQNSAVVLAPKIEKKNKINLEKNEKGVFNFTETELAEDTSLRLISSENSRGETKYASFEDYLKDH